MDSPNASDGDVHQDEDDLQFELNEGLSYLMSIPNDSIDLVLTDPPYIISRETGMNTHFNNVKHNEQMGIETTKTPSEWEAYKEKHDIPDDTNKPNYIKFGSIYGRKYCVQTDYGDWDSQFTIDTLEKFIQSFYKKLKKGGTLILFFDLWKIETLKTILERNKFKQIRFIEWIKTNPQPLNSKTNYLTNCREIALTCVKGSKPTFNSKHDNGIYMFPLQGSRNRFHPTQKSLKLIEALIEKHSNENDTVLDPFLGSGTTLFACRNKKRKFRGCEMHSEYFDQMKTLWNASSVS